MKYKKIELDFEYDALEPFIDAATMKSHYEGHHTSYEANLEKTVKNIDVSKFNTLEDLMRGYQSIEDPVARVGVRQFGGGLINHNFLFKMLKTGTTLKNGPLKKAIEEKWGSLEEAKKEFESSSMGLFGSGWVWLVKDKTVLKIIKTFNQDSPIFLKMKPIIGIDLWEHSYYLKHKSGRANYVKDYWNVVNWDQAEKNFSE